MVFFASPEPLLGKVAEKLKSKLFSFIWVPWEERKEYIKKSDAVLIGPGLMRYRKEGGETFDKVGKETKKITEELLSRFSHKQWVIDAGSLQVMEPKYIPKKAILTPNQKEYQLLFDKSKPEEMAKRYQCIIVKKNVETLVCSAGKCQMIKGGNEGLSKGGTGDVLAGLTVALAAQNLPFFAACAASFIVKKAADVLYQKFGFAYNADDLAGEIPKLLGEYIC